MSGPRWPLRRRWPDGGDGAERRPDATESTETVSLAFGTIARFRVILGPGASVRHERAVCPPAFWGLGPSGEVEVPMPPCYTPRPIAPAGIGACIRGPIRP